MSAFRTALIDELIRSRSANYDDNFDVMNLKPSALESPLERPLEDPATAALVESDPARYFEQRFGDRLELGEYLFTCLADEPSRELLIKLMAYRLLGYRHVKLPRNTPAYWAGIEHVKSLKTTTPPLPIGWRDLSLAEYDMRKLGFEMKLFAGDMGLTCTLLQRQYEYNSAEISIKAELGDIVFDCGACWGETTLYFAHEAGPSGLVYSFEFIPSNLAVLRQNIISNPDLGPRIQLIERPLWKMSELNLFYLDDGPGSYVTDNQTERAEWDGKVSTQTIDDVVLSHKLPRVDFIKMDIEGAELAALKGAEQSIKVHRPKLAISLYHAPEDFDLIPRYLSELDLGYAFYLGHHTIYENETVLYCSPHHRPSV